MANPLLTIAQLLTPTSGAQYRSMAVFALQQLGLQPQNWAPGGGLSSILTVACNLLGMLSGGQDNTGQNSGLSYAIAQQWNPTASGGGLQLLSKYFYGVTPPQPTFAGGTLTLVNTGGGLYTFAAGQAQFASTVKNSQGVIPTYTNTAPFTLNPLQTLSIPIQATFAGSGGNSAPGFITQVVTSMLGVTCSNPNPVLGSDALTDAALRALNTASLYAKTPFGPRGAYAYAIGTATNIVSGAPVNINRQSVSPSSHTGIVTIYVCGPQGTTDPNDLAGVAQCIESGAGSTDPNFFGARPDGVTVGPSTVTIGGVTIGSPAAAVPVSYAPTGVQVYVLAPKGTRPVDVQTAILNQLSAFFSSPANPIGGIVASDDSHTTFQGILESGVSGVIAQGVATVPGCTMLSTAFQGAQTDLALAANQVATLGITSSTLTVFVQYAS